MTNPLTMKSWSPYLVGLGIGVLSWFAYASADHLLGITMAFEHTAALSERAVAPQIDETNEYYSQQAQEGRPPKIGWEWMLVVGVFFGALISSLLSGDHTRLKVPELWEWRFGPNVAKRLTAALLGGAVMMFGARLAQGCTSGHGISGNLQLAVSSWAFTATIFAVGIATAFLLYGREGRRHV